MGAALNAPIHDDIDAVAHGIDNLGKLIECRARAVQLATSVVGQDYSCAAYLYCAFCVRHGHDALEAEMAVPQPHHFCDVAPVHGGVQHLGEVAADRHGAAAHLDVLIELG